MSLLKDLPIHMYYHVPRCPVCYSDMTGRFIKFHNQTEADWAINESLRNGELVKPQSEMTDNNVFCLDCGHTWKAVVNLSFVSYNTIEEEKEKRHTKEILNERVIEKGEEDKKPKAFGHIRRFIGKV